MKRLVTAALLALGAGAAQAEDVTLQLKWVTQAQFAGYYVAQAKGFYEEEGLNVTILPGGPVVAPTQVIAGGGADVVVDWMPSALAAREKGLALVNIAQPFKSSGMMLTCLKESGVAAPTDNGEPPSYNDIVAHQGRLWMNDPANPNRFTWIVLLWLANKAALSFWNLTSS